MTERAAAVAFPSLRGTNYSTPPPQLEPPVKKHLTALLAECQTALIQREFKGLDEALPSIGQINAI